MGWELLVIFQCVVVLTTPSGSSVAADEYQLYMDWKDGRQDPRLEGLEDAVKLEKISRSLGVKAAKLRAVIDKVEPVEGELALRSAAAVRSALAETPIAGSILTVEVDTSSGHVVAGVKWRCGDRRDREKGAAWVAWAVGQSGPLIKTLATWCVDEEGKKRFSAKIARSAFRRIRREHVSRFAATRYIRLFEGVRRGVHQ